MHCSAVNCWGEYIRDTRWGETFIICSRMQTTTFMLKKIFSAKKNTVKGQGGFGSIRTFALVYVFIMCVRFCKN